MNNIPTGSDTKNAPWNTQEVKICDNCGVQMEEDDSGDFKGVKWINWKCTECDYKFNEEPDYD